MQHRTRGSQGPEVAAIGYGATGLTEPRETRPQRISPGTTTQGTADPGSQGTAAGISV
ncbi:hypothetical protein OG372_00495 [Streptomyces sp. NBC_01020]|uniref:hypothetical protein n=1 Tax=Streptomyces sp. NBC_01020 TaxID=2903722 RepID=UPI00386401E0|nr:hypothetical protein OG372_00495 [Streptomyces sp. NBC_01020]